MRSTKPRPEHDRARAGTDSENLTGSYVEIDPPSTQPDSPDGFIYIVRAVTRIIEWFSCPGRVSWTPAVALNLLTKAGRLGEFRGSLLDGHGPNGTRILRPSDWDDIQFGLNQACLLVAGQRIGLHGVLLPAHDFDYWLEEGPAEKLRTSLSESTAVQSDQAKPEAPGRTAEPPKELREWFEDLERSYPQLSLSELTAALKQKPGRQTYSRKILSALLKSPDGQPRRRGKKPGKSDGEHDHRMRQFAGALAK
jgi:hypothetical protein